jgi:hypothetical protein
MGTNNGISYSYDSLNWVNNTILTTCRCIKYNPKTSLWVAGGTGSTNNLVYSTNGINWVGSSLLITDEVIAIGCNDSMWIASGLLLNNSSIMIYSFNGINWVESISGSSVITNCSSIIWNGNMWVAGGDVIGYSYDGINWISNYTASCTSLSWTGLYWTTGNKYSSDGIKDIYEVTPYEASKDALMIYNRIHKEDFERTVNSIAYSAKNLSVWKIH